MASNFENELNTYAADHVIVEDRNINFVHVRRWVRTSMSPPRFQGEPRRISRRGPTNWFQQRAVSDKVNQNQILRFVEISQLFILILTKMPTAFLES